MRTFIRKNRKVFIGYLQQGAKQEYRFPNSQMHFIFVAALHEINAKGVKKNAARSMSGFEIGRAHV